MSMYFIFDVTYQLYFYNVLSSSVQQLMWNLYLCELRICIKTMCVCCVLVFTYFGYISALHVVFVDLDLLLVLRSHFSQGRSKFVLVLILPSRVHLHQTSLIPLPRLLHFL